jgi:two-component system sensor histidine kinase KdpD
MAGLAALLGQVWPALAGMALVTGLIWLSLHGVAPSGKEPDDLVLLPGRRKGQTSRRMGDRTLPRWAVWSAAVLAPPALTVLLEQLSSPEKRNYVFFYLALVAVVAVFGGIGPALVAAAASFVLVDYYFVPPFHTLTIAEPEDTVNLFAFAVTAALVGLLAARRRQALIEAEEATRRLREANLELVRLNREQAAAAEAAVRLARSEEKVRALQEADRLRRDLLATVSHELRTPLGTILTESTDPSGSEERRRLRVIAAEARRLKALVDDMLDVTRIEGRALELTLEPTDLSDAIEAAADRLHRSAPTRPVEWDRATASLPVLADWERLGQILDNLLVNADRMAPACTPIRIGTAKEASGFVAVRVSDSGPGVPPELRERIFERFNRGTATNGSTGTGLGLAIVRGLVEAHGGAVEVEANGGSGATFRFTLPAAPESD